ncbi:unnamed protein product [Kuraishia capsulata CBS 1993]|uniref:Major facilitator superfamily (MFS) profile domain-containing protein n=1 Tax=Kuraishia capsulata CBS 1993 TaxID=1382522 RepID=W6MWA0_9ASCO|nr:uncharacterized protein KUCA_T00003057001 [Kuraishia capsulata CBS 1993]CDK27080.1 unnamed protein product [Kuraishia capsulata CBS 1993]
MIREMFKDPLVGSIVCFASLGGLLFGYDQGVISGIVTMESFGAKFPRINTDSDYKGWFVSTFLLCAWFGSLINSPIVDKFGRRDSIRIACVIFVIGSVFQCAGHSTPMLFAGRGVAGLGVGQLTMVVPMYMSELAPPNIRGGLVVIQQVSITLGILISFWLDYGTNFIGGTRCAPHVPYKNGKSFNPYTDVPAGGCTGQSDASWRIPFGLQIAPAFVLGIGMMFFPRSPRWLLYKGREEEAVETLKYLRRRNTESEIEQELAEIRADVIFENGYADRKFGKITNPVSLYVAGIWDILTTRSHFKRVFIGSAVMFFQQFMGCNAIIYYAPTIFSQLGMNSNTTSLLGTGVYGIVNCLSTFPAVFLIDRTGRRTLLMAGAIGTFVSLVIVGGIVGKYGSALSEHKTAGRTAVAFIFIYDVNFSYSWAPIGWVLPSEIFSIGIRSKAISITTSSTWMNNFIIGLVTPRMLDTMKWGTYIFFAAFCIIAFLFTLFVIPETKGVPLEEMDRIFGDEDAQLNKQHLAEVGAFRAESLKGSEERIESASE